MHNMEQDKNFAKAIAAGYVLVYRPGFTNFCPGCAASHWHVGRHTAECANCSAALPIAAKRSERGAIARPSWRSALTTG
jgi:hypothetical protein